MTTCTPDRHNETFRTLIDRFKTYEDGAEAILQAIQALKEHRDGPRTMKAWMHDMHTNRLVRDLIQAYDRFQDA